MDALRGGPWTAVAILVGVALAGCLSNPPTDGTGTPGAYTFPEPTVGGNWTVEDANGSLATVRLTASTEYARDGSTRTAPVLRLDADPLPIEQESVHYRTRYWIYQLGPDGVADARSEGDLVADTPAGTSTFEQDVLDSVPDPAHDRGFTSPYLYGPGLWGTTWTVGESRTVPEALIDGWQAKADPPTFELTRVVDGCAHVDVDAPGMMLPYEATVVFCGGPVPTRVQIHEPRPRNLTLERTATGDDLPDPVPTAEPDRVERGTFPVDGSDLPFPLEEAAEAIRVDPATWAWLAAHPDARAVQGRLAPVGCSLPDAFSDVEDRCESVADADVLRWEIVLAGADEGLRVRVRKPMTPLAGPATVDEVVPANRSVSGSPLNRTVSLADALDVVDRLRDDDWNRIAVSFWTHTDSPFWAVQGQREADDGGLYASPVNVYWADGRLAGYVDPPS